jgi:formylglycine-generating enzyme required for sulfatase activity
VDRNIQVGVPEGVSTEKFDEILRLAGSDFVVNKGDTESGRVAPFTHKTTGIRFRYVPGGSFTMGLTKEQERASRRIADPPPLTISELQPSLSVAVRPFLISEKPVPICTVKALLGSASIGKELRDQSDTFPAYVVRETALQLGQRMTCRLPSEAEWEYACRAGSTTLFIWGDGLPDDQELDQWLNLEHKAAKSNTFGLACLFAGDWCLDEYRASHEENAPANPGVFVIKGGGSVFWPWQGSGEWVWCMPAMRMPSTDLIDGKCAFRLVRSLTAGAD